MPSMPESAPEGVPLHQMPVPEEVAVPASIDAPSSEMDEGPKPGDEIRSSGGASLDTLEVQAPVQQVSLLDAHGYLSKRIMDRRTETDFRLFAGKFAKYALAFDRHLAAIEGVEANKRALDGYGAYEDRVAKYATGGSIVMGITAGVSTGHFGVAAGAFIVTAVTPMLGCKAYKGWLSSFQGYLKWREDAACESLNRCVRKLQRAERFPVQRQATSFHNLPLYDALDNLTFFEPGLSNGWSTVEEKEQEARKNRRLEITLTEAKVMFLGALSEFYRDGQKGALDQSLQCARILVDGVF